MEGAPARAGHNRLCVGTKIVPTRRVRRGILQLLRAKQPLLRPAWADIFVIMLATTGSTETCRPPRYPVRGQATRCAVTSKHFKTNACAEEGWKIGMSAWDKESLDRNFLNPHALIDLSQIRLPSQLAQAGHDSAGCTEAALTQDPLHESRRSKIMNEFTWKLAYLALAKRHL